MSISPTPGRIVWYWPSNHETLPCHAGQPLAALVAAVHTDRLVNLSVIDAAGVFNPRRNVTLRQPEDDGPEDRSASYCEWMPYQVGQAAKAEQGQTQEQLASQPTPAEAATDERPAEPEPAEAPVQADSPEAEQPIVEVEMEGQEQQA